MRSPLFPPDAGPGSLPAGTLFLDARTGADSYARGHLRGALHTDLEQHPSRPGLQRASTPP